MASMLKGMGNQLKGMATEAATHYQGHLQNNLMMPQNNMGYPPPPQQSMDFSQQNQMMGYPPPNISMGYPPQNTSIGNQSLLAIFFASLSICCLSYYIYRIKMSPNGLQLSLIASWIASAVLIGFLISGLSPMMGLQIWGIIILFIGSLLSTSTGLAALT